MKKTRIHFGLLYIILIMILIPISVYLLSARQEKKDLDRKVLSVETSKKIEKEEPNNELKEITDSFFEDKEGEYSIFVKNLKTNESYQLNPSRKFDSASLYKLWVMVLTFEKIRDGELKENDILTAEINKLEETLSLITPTPTPQDFSPTPSTEEPKKFEISVGEALEKMISISDNYSAVLLSSRVGAKNIANFIKEEGFIDSNYKQPPQTSARDVGLFFEKLYRGEFIDREYSNIMIDLLKKQTLNDRIPKYLEKEVEVAHKTGELFNSKHDGGIVFSSKGDYVIVVLSETNDYKEASENIAKYSEAIFKYFNSSVN